MLRLAVILAIAAAGLADILMGTALILKGALRQAMGAPGDPKSAAVFVVVAAAFAAPPLALWLWRNGRLGPSLIAAVAPLAAAALAGRFGV